MTNPQAEELPPEDAKAGPQRVWLLVVWVALWVGICCLLNTQEMDPGVGNSAINATVILSVLGFSLWVLSSSGWGSKTKWSMALVPFSLVFAFYMQLLPIEVLVDGDVGVVGWRWRWNKPDQQLVVPAVTHGQTIDWQATDQDYPRFLGKGYWAEVPGVSLETDWQTHPPRELWRREIGAGWSAFSIVGNYAVTQEQRGEQELVTCYEVNSGKIVWTHADPVRWDPRGTGSMGYAGPRATPTLHQGRVFTQGATGILNCLDAASGKLHWSHDTLAKHDAVNVNWGKSGAPLIVGEYVVVSVGGKQNQSLVAYEIETGAVAWATGTYQSSYASPVLAKIAGQSQVLSVDEGYVTSHAADDGQFLWEYEWPSDSGADATSSQPVPLTGDRVFMSKGYSHGSALVQITSDEGGDWFAEPLWKGRQFGQLPVMKTKMCNVVIRDGYVYGLDDINLQCIELATGKKRWKKRRTPKFGHGQIMLIGDVILLLTEHGEVVLVEPSPEKYQELASFQALSEDQITWNNPAFAPPYLLLRNAQEAVCYELSLQGENVVNNN